MTRRKLEALRALAERPGTPAEGEVARAMLAKAEAALPHPQQEASVRFAADLTFYHMRWEDAFSLTFRQEL